MHSSANKTKTTKSKHIRQGDEDAPPTFQGKAEKVRTGIDGEASLPLLPPSFPLHSLLQHLTEVLRHFVEEGEETRHSGAQHHLLVELQAVRSPLLAIPVDRRVTAGPSNQLT